LRAAQQAALWDTRPSPKSQIPFGPLAGRGVSCVLYEGNNGYSAMIAHVEVDYNTGVVTVKSMTGVVESGPVSNPDGMINQTEGGYMQGMSRALYEQVKWNAKAGIITSIDWNTYPVFQWGQPIPQVKVVVINNPNVSQTGAGELGITLSASAIGNAIFDCIGVRVRQIPYTPANVLAAIAASVKK
jgi:CO/xanthine dehydrogenase Mo-binding subunit